MIKQYRYAEISIDDIFHRTEEKTDVADAVAEILADVRKNGDEALRRYSERFDSAKLDVLEVTAEERVAAMAAVDPELIAILEEAAANIRAFHEKQKRTDFVITEKDGVVLGQKIIPLDRAGVYVPGGTACYPSTVLMDTIPAKIAGVGEIIMTTPAKGGKINPVILAAAEIAGVDRIFKAGGAQAIAAMAYGTESIPKTDKIFGPGNQYVTVAKQQVSTSTVAIDMPAGPSEVLVMADSGAVPAFVASDLLSQAEHGSDSQAILLTPSRGFAEQVVREVERQLAELPRRDIATRALDNSRIVVMDSEDDLIAFSNAYGPEHLIISMENPWKIAERITAAGSVFIGNYTPESAGDYASGTNHTLPTYGWAHAYSGVNLDSFLRKITYQEITTDGLRGIGNVIETMAGAEGLDAHKNAVTIRLKSLG